MLPILALPSYLLYVVQNLMIHRSIIPIVGAKVTKISRILISYYKEIAENLAIKASFCVELIFDILSVTYPFLLQLSKSPCLSIQKI